MQRNRNFCAYINGPNRKTIVQDWMSKCEWLIGQDEIGSHGMEHIQVMFGFKNARSLTAVRNLMQNANIEIVSDSEKMLKYCTDESKRDPNGDLYCKGDVPNFNKKVNKNVIDEALALPSYEDAMLYIENTDKLFYIQNQKKLSFYFTQKYDCHDVALYTRESFIRPFFDKFDKVLVFIGPTGIGKTQFALSHFTHPLHVRDKEDWRRFNTSITGIILDDLDFPKWSPLTFLKLLDIETPITQNVKYGSVRIPAKVPRIICVNHEDLLWPHGIHEETRKACERRIILNYFNDKLFSTSAIAPTSDDPQPSTSNQDCTEVVLTGNVVGPNERQCVTPPSDTSLIEELFKSTQVTPRKLKKNKTQ